ncbi:MAG: hypothetical protein C1943_06510 [Halochromatium sp.]|nr:hypothetical protein [Halochromatium sp.]
MKLAIMQPYFFPYIGYWQLVNAVDCFVVYDNIQFSKSGWFYRNYILLNGKKVLFTLPLKKDSSYIDVKNRFLAENAREQIKKILHQIQNGYRKAPQFEKAFPLVKDIFLCEKNNLFDYIYNSIEQVCSYLGIVTPLIVSSTIDIDHKLKSKEKVIAINKALSSNHYINLIGGKELYDNESFKRQNIQLSFLESDLPIYKQFQFEFQPSLSIIDILMFNSPKEIKEMLEKYKLTKH